MSETIADDRVRRRALDPTGSFVVQAPAGSGKTELLTRRVLRLLAGVDHPEEILAITFTRKAAAEMRQRLIQALRAADRPPPEEPHRRETWELARAARARDRERGWALARSPNRLRVQTIDSLCASITRQMPSLARLGAPPRTLEDATPLYLEAARNTLAALNEPAGGPADGPGDAVAIGAAVARLLRHLENRQERAAELLVELLARRDQWLRHVAAGNRREALEDALRRAVTEHLADLDRTLAPELKQELSGLAGFAARNRRRFGKPLAGLEPWLDRDTPPGTALEDLPAWQGLAHLVFKKAGPEPLGRVDVRHGFPASTAADGAEERRLFDERKRTLAERLAELSLRPSVCALFSAARELPHPTYSDDQWRLLDALAQVLLRAAAELQLIFQERGEVDFSEVQQRALQALGAPEAPTDLALALDYRLRHVLVDEFQDTSSAQYALLRLLTAGWQPGDGRTLFAVGDPMQSIYRFREAEVGHYLRARRHGIGDLHPQALDLEVNFRSRQGVVDWVNQVFPQVLPEGPDIATGAVPYSPSRARHPAEPGPAVELHPFAERDDAAEAQRVVELVGQALEDGQEQVAILGRARSHLHAVVAALRAAGLRFQALELEPLAHTHVVQDLRALTRALLHPADRLAWLSVLRAPWCGLGLADLLAVAGEAEDPPAAESSPDAVLIPARLRDPDRLAGLSPDGRNRLARVAAVLLAAVEGRRRRGLRSWVESTWLRLGGAAVLRGAGERDTALAFFALLDEHDRAADLPDLAAFDQALERLYAPPDRDAEPRLQVMTMHKAKGLEFDTVILPGLGRPPPPEDSPLLAWLERPAPGGDADLLLAPIKPSRATGEPIYAYVRGLNAAKSRLEDGRLLYVAATRARRRLHLLGHARPSGRDGEPKPASGSLLAGLWPALSESFRERLAAQPDDPRQEELPLATAPPTSRLRRLPADWRPPAPGPLPVRGAAPATPTTGAPVEPPALSMEWADPAARHVGTLVHRWMERIGNEGPAQWPPGRLGGLLPSLRLGLRALGVGEQGLEEAAERCLAALRNSLDDPRGRWILERADEAGSELPLTVAESDDHRHFVVDRTFVADGVRWVVDYKTSEPEPGEALDDFLARERERYRDQLAGYGRLITRLDDRPIRPIRLGLYFPLCRGWVEWAFNEP